jgi:hypothetical protein
MRERKIKVGRTDTIRQPDGTRVRSPWCAGRQGTQVLVESSYMRAYHLCRALQGFYRSWEARPCVQQFYL